MSESGTRNRRVSLVLGSDVRGEWTLGEPVNATGAAVSSAIHCAGDDAENQGSKHKRARLRSKGLAAGLASTTRLSEAYLRSPTARSLNRAIS